MRSILENLQKSFRIITVVTLAFIICIGTVMVLFQVRPFWVDEWFIIYSLKTKSTAEIFGQLEFMQQFPRVYLALLKAFTSFCNYSYFSLRLPSCLVSIATIVLSYKIMKKLFAKQVFTRYLFIMILVSSFTFTEYFVEMKQYSMDILLSIFALWQLTEVINLKYDTTLKTGRYTFLCAGFLVAPFFSYTYPIAILPAYVVMFLQTIALLKNKPSPSVKSKILILKWIPLTIGIVGVLLFYMIDARRLANDAIMYDRWSFLMIDKDQKVYSFLKNVYTLFSQVGSGLLFETLFGILGVSSFIYGVVRGVRSYVKKENSIEAQIGLYSSLLLILTIILFLFGKLPLGTPRLNAFTVPSISILIIYFIDRISGQIRGMAQKIALPAILFIGVTGNVYCSYVNYFTSPKYKKQMSIYAATEIAIRLAQAKKIPILITNGVAYPYERAVIDAGAPSPAVWVLKTFPAYNMGEHLPVFAISDTNMLSADIASLPVDTRTVLIGDGVSFRMYDFQK